MSRKKINKKSRLIEKSRGDMTKGNTKLDTKDCTIRQVGTLGNWWENKDKELRHRRCTENNINKIKNNKYKMGPRHRELRIGPLGHFQQKPLTNLQNSENNCFGSVTFAYFIKI